MIADAGDHTQLARLYRTHYPPRHPLFSTEFWNWQYGEADGGRCVIARALNGDIVAHVGCYPGGGIVWLQNILVDPSHRGRGLVDRLLGVARESGPLAVAVANAAGQRLLEKRQWFRHPDLQRHVLLNPAVRNLAVADWIAAVPVDLARFPRPEGRYWRQPGIRGIVLDDGSEAVAQQDVGGLRLHHLVNPRRVAEQAWALGVRWLDFVSSWNDPLVAEIVASGWRTDVPVPWYLNPVDHTAVVTLNLFSEKPLARDFLFHRAYADVGRVGTL